MKQILRILSVLLIIIGYVNLLALFTRQYSADMQDKLSKSTLTSSVDASLQYASQAILNNPSEPSYYIQRAKVYLVLGPEYKKFALNDLETARQLNPTNLATLRNSIPVYYFLSIQDLHLPVGSANVDTIYEPKTLQEFSRLETYVPNDAGSLLVLAKYYKRMEVMDSYDRVVSRISTLRPDLLDWALN